VVATNGDGKAAVMWKSSDRRKRCIKIERFVNDKTAGQSTTKCRRSAQNSSYRDLWGRDCLSAKSSGQRKSVHSLSSVNTECATTRAPLDRLSLLRRRLICNVDSSQRKTRRA